MISVNSDYSSLLIRRNIDKSSNSINSALERMSTGYRINHAKDDAANLFISENLKTKIQSCDILKTTTSMNLDMLSNVERALQDVTDSLFRIRDLTLQQLNGYYDKSSLDAITDEINQQVEQIVQITKRTNFNGKNLLDGTAKGMLASLYDTPEGLTGLNMDELFKPLDFIDEFTVISRNLSHTSPPSEEMLIKTDSAIDDVTRRRALLGTYINVLESARSRNIGLQENLEATKSTLMDADFAQESSKLVNNQILQNISASLLTQAGNVQRNILFSLLT